MEKSHLNEHIRYEPDEKSPLFLSIQVGFQGVVLSLAPTVLYVSIVALAAGQGERYLSWAVFAALVINGGITALQAARIGRFGVGHMLISGTTPSFIAISITALVEGGPAMLASLIVVSSLLQFALAAWLPLLRRIITPVVSGTVLMLIAAILIPIAFDNLQQAPEGASLTGGLLSALASLVVATVLGLRATGALRLWSSLIAIAAGCIVAAFFGLYDIQGVIQAPWFGFPESALPGLDLGLSARFWAILPMFLVVTLVDTIRAVGDSIVIQRVSRRGPRVTDFRLVQGAVNANGLGTLAAGIAGTPPPITYSAASVTLTQLTGVASRRVGYAIATMFLGLALLPKLAALLLTIPSPVIGAYLLIILGPLFLEGMKTVVQDNPDYRNALVVAVAFPIGVGLQNQMFLADLLGGAWSTLLSNGLTVGALVAILMTSFLELTSPRRRRLKVDVGIASLPKLDAFLHEFASKIGWDGESRERLRAVGEETLLSLFRQNEDYESDQARGLILYARSEGEAVELEFLAFSEQENIEDRMAHMGEWLDTSDEHGISSHLLRHYASSVHHRKYHDIDIVKIHVEGSR